MKTRKLSYVFLVVFTLIIFAYFYICLEYIIPDNYTVIEGFSVKSALPYGIYPDETIKVSDGGKLTDRRTIEDSGTQKVTLKVLNLIPAKKVSVTTVENPLLYPSGECVGIKMYSKGIIVTGFSDFETRDGICVSPGAIAGLKSGDVIVSVNGTHVSSVSEFTYFMDLCKKECVLEILRGDKGLNIEVTPRLCEDGHRRIGVYVKNSVAGVGTMTFVDKNNNGFAALGHGVTDYDTGIVLPMQSASLYKADILSITKGKKGIPGEIIGAIDEKNLIGECTGNSDGGVFGIMNEYKPGRRGIYAASREEVKEGAATILCTVDEEGIPKEYSVKILSVSRIGTNKTKSFTIEVTDKSLLEKTGGIVQGMSGSPIVQNGKLVGAVTHVFVNDPTRGYGIFIENMLAEAEKIK